MLKRSAALQLACLAACLAFAPAARAADVQVEQLELLTHGALNESSGSFEVSSRMFFDMTFSGGDKFGGLLRLTFLNGDIEDALSQAGNEIDTLDVDPPPVDADVVSKLNEVVDKVNASTSPRVKTAAVTARSWFGLPIDLSYFVGYMDSFASGDDFGPLFGSVPFTTELRGPMVYPEGIGGNTELWYEGIHAVNGTGFRASTTPKLAKGFTGMFYIYQDSDIGAGSWSGDVRGLFNKEKVKFEVFAGASTESGGLVYRAGALFYAFSGDVGEFFAQVGIPKWDPNDEFSLQNLFFLFEPRVNFEAGSVAITVFSHPAWYRQRATLANGRFDVAFNLRFGRISRDGAQGGAQMLMALKPSDTKTPATINVAPYYSLIAGGIQWDFKLDLRLFPFPSPWYGTFQPFIGLKTSF